MPTRRSSDNHRSPMSSSLGYANERGLEPRHEIERGSEQEIQQYADTGCTQGKRGMGTTFRLNNQSLQVVFMEKRLRIEEEEGLLYRSPLEDLGVVTYLRGE
eukprot:1327472-Amorphochlora_amoeboformis.AAC.2